MKLPFWVKAIGVIAIIFFVYSIFAAPDEAAGFVGGGYDHSKTGLGQIGEFFDALLSQ